MFVIDHPGRAKVFRFRPWPLKKRKEYDDGNERRRWKRFGSVRFGAIQPSCDWFHSSVEIKNGSYFCVQRLSLCQLLVAFLVPLSHTFICRDIKGTKPLLLYCSVTRCSQPNTVLELNKFGTLIDTGISRRTLTSDTDTSCEPPSGCTARKALQHVLTGPNRILLLDAKVLVGMAIGRCGVGAVTNLGGLSDSFVKLLLHCVLNGNAVRSKSARPREEPGIAQRFMPLFSFMTD